MWRNDFSMGSPLSYDMVVLTFLVGQRLRMPTKLIRPTVGDTPGQVARLGDRQRPVLDRANLSAGKIKQLTN
jgi:hypothetical protein